jgi:hypothetical protein
VVLPTNNDATYDDSVTDPSQKLHQQHHDSLHALYNAYEGTAPADFATAADLTAIDTRVDTLEAVDNATQAELDAHTGDTSDAHDASAVSFTPTGTIAATNVQDAIAEVASEGGGGGGGTFSGAIVSNSGTQSIPNTAFTPLLFNTETVDTDGYHDNSTNTDRLTVSETGYYLVVGSCIIAIGIGHRYIEIYKNGTTRMSLQAVPAWNDSGYDAAASISQIVSLTAGDYITIRAFQDSGSAKDASGIKAQIVKLG